MNVDNRIHYDIGELIASTEQVLDELRIFCHEARYLDLLGKNLIEKINNWACLVWLSMELLDQCAGRNWLIGFKKS